MRLFAAAAAGLATLLCLVSLANAGVVKRAEHYAAGKCDSYHYLPSLSSLLTLLTTLMQRPHILRMLILSTVPRLFPSAVGLTTRSVACRVATTAPLRPALLRTASVM